MLLRVLCRPTSWRQSMVLKKYLILVEAVWFGFLEESMDFFGRSDYFEVVRFVGIRGSLVRSLRGLNLRVVLLFRDYSCA